jgi:hypothetical protein
MGRIFVLSYIIEQIQTLSGFQCVLSAISLVLTDSWIAQPCTLLHIQGPLRLLLVEDLHMDLASDHVSRWHLPLLSMGRYKFEIHGSVAGKVAKAFAKADAPHLGRCLWKKPDRTIQPPARTFLV